MADHLEVRDSDLSPTAPADPGEPHLILWNTAAFAALRPDAAEQRLRLDQLDASERLLGSFVGLRDGTEVASGGGAPFGGVDVVKPNETVANIEAVVDRSFAQLAAAGVREVEVRCRPAHYGATDRIVEHVLLNRGLGVRSCELNFFLDLDGYDSVDDYVRALKPAARKMLRRSLAQDLSVAQLRPDDTEGWQAAYEVLRRNRVDRGRPMRLPFDYIEAIRDAFPGRVRMLTIGTGDVPCAAALVYRVLPGRDLVQYWGDAGHDLAISPMNALVHTVVEHALAAGARTIDIGISTEDGVPNHGLIQFKRSVGCEVETRLVLQGALAGAPS